MASPKKRYPDLLWIKNHVTSRFEEIWIWCKKEFWIIKLNIYYIFYTILICQKGNSYISFYEIYCFDPFVGKFSLNEIDFSYEILKNVKIQFAESAFRNSISLQTRKSQEF